MNATVSMPRSCSKQKGWRGEGGLLFVSDKTGAGENGEGATVPPGACTPPYICPWSSLVSAWSPWRRISGRSQPCRTRERHPLLTGSARGRSPPSPVSTALPSTCCCACKSPFASAESRDRGVRRSPLGGGEGGSGVGSPSSEFGTAVVAPLPVAQSSSPSQAS